MTEDDDDTPPKKTNGKDHGHIVSFPSADERERLRREKLQAEEQKRRDEKAWQKAYKDRQKGEKVPFFTGRMIKIPLFTKAAVLTLILIHLVTSLLPQEVYAQMIVLFAFIPGIYTGAAEWQWSALISPLTSLVIHFGWMHLVLNAFMLLVTGFFFEKAFGTRRALMFFIVCGLAGNLMYFIINPFSPHPVVGASGAIDGFFAIFLIMNWARMPLPPHMRKRGHAPILLFWCAMTIVLGLIFQNTAWEAHLGGMLAGWGIFELWNRGFIKV